jgi:nicotinic acid mononucleotide adenylyltransferase
MSDLAAYQFLYKMLDRKTSLYLVATGAGSGIQDALWKIPGCSAFLRGASFPYDPKESALFAGVTPEKYVSPEFAFDLAFSAYMRAIDLDRPDVEPVGLAVTASVASVREHRGDHRAHIVCMTRDKIVERTLLLEKGAGTDARAKDGRLVDGAALATLLGALGLMEGQWSSLDEEARKHFFRHPVFWPDGHRAEEDCLDLAWPLFPGAFDPPHEGHEAIANTLRGTDRVCEPVFAICSNPPHKPALTVQEMLRRAKMLRHRVVYFTQDDPLYIDKARQHPGTPLVIGADALLRMLDPKWGIDPKAMFEEFYNLDTKFLVFGREVEGRYVTAQEAISKIPLEGKRLTRTFRAIDGRWDVSSTVLRSPDRAVGCTRSDGSAPTGSSGLPAPSPTG